MPKCPGTFECDTGPTTGTRGTSPELEQAPLFGLIVGVPSDYRVPQPLLVRFLGLFLVLMGATVFVLAVVVALVGMPRTVLSVGVVLVVLAVVGVGFTLTRTTTVLHLDDMGYQVRLLRQPGVREARWKDVEDVVTATLSGHDCVVLRLRDGRTTTIPVSMVDASADALVRDLREHLDRGHGYRRLR